MLLRSYIPTAVRVEITDPQDPTPYVYLSTREPQAWWRRSRPYAPDPGGGRPRPSARPSGPFTGPSTPGLVPNERP